MEKLILAVLLVLVACGGGSYDAAIPAAAKLRTDLYFGYYGAFGNQLEETSAHTNLLFESQWEGVDAAMNRIEQAKRATILDVSTQIYARNGEFYYRKASAESDLRALLTQFDAHGLLRYIVALYPIDEPNNTVRPISGRDLDGEIAANNALIRRVAREFPALANVKLAAIYNNAGDFPGVASYDWIGFDHYDSRSGIFTNGEYARLKAALRPDQRIILVPGGAFGQDPAPFLNQAETDNQVIGIIVFIWPDNWGGMTNLGVHGNGMARAYCLAGSQIKNPGSSSSC